MTSARSSTASNAAHNNSAYSSRLRSKPGGTRPNYAEDDSDVDRAIAEHDPAPRSNPTRQSAPKSAATAASSSSTTNMKRRRSESGDPSSSSVSDLDSDLDLDGNHIHPPPPPTSNPGVKMASSDQSKPTTIAGTANQAGKRGPSSSNGHAQTGKKRKSNSGHTATVAGAASVSTTSDLSAIPSPATISLAPTKTNRKVKAATPSLLTDIPPRPRTMYLFENSGARLNAALTLIADDGTTFARNDYVYLICEPPGEPYYVGRIMEFRHQVPDSNLTASTSPKSLDWPVTGIRVNWVYRPRDVQRAAPDSRLVYATMHSDICPIFSLRGTCQVVHRAEIEDIDQYRKLKDAFWFNQAFDRFIHRWYEVIPTPHVINVPENVKNALDTHWKYIIVEAAKVKELTSAAKTCNRCTKYCASSDSVECAVCHTSFHMNCVRPPLLKKPSRGFAWACAPCNRAQERRMEADKIVTSGRHGAAGVGEVQRQGIAEEEEVVEDEEEPPTGTASTIDGSQAPTSLDGSQTIEGGTQSDDEVDGIPPVAEAEIAQAEMWHMRYLGMHCRIEDVLQYDDRAIYPRASSRLGPRHQAVVSEWFGQPVQLVKVAEVKKKGGKGGLSRKDTKAAAAAAAAEEANRPGWIQNEPLGYVARGEDVPENDAANTAKLQFKLPKFGEFSDRGIDDNQVLSPEGQQSGDQGQTEDGNSEAVDAYIKRAKALAKSIGVPDYSVDFLDRAVRLFHKNNFNAEVALKQLRRTDRTKDLRDPNAILTTEEKAKFEDGVALYGSEIRNVRLHAGILNHSDAVRYYYLWKKTPKGREIWGGYSGRKGIRKKSESADPTARVADELADEQDDSAFDSEKAVTKRRRFQCKFCAVRRSRLWRRAPIGPGGTESGRGGSSGGGGGRGVVYVPALCHRCAGLWRRYAVRWEDGEEIGKRVAQGGGRAWRRRIDEELLSEWRRVQEEGPGVEEEYDPTADPPPKKKAKKVEPIKDDIESKELKVLPKDSRAEAKAAVAKPDSKPSPVTISAPAPEKELATPEPRKKAPAVVTTVVSVVPSPPRPPTPPEPPRFRALPCAVCQQWEIDDIPPLICTICRLHVHAGCFGISDRSSSTSWTCDMCTNDKIGKESTSYMYECVLCPVSETEQELVESASTRQVDKDAASKFTEDYRLQQRQYGRPVHPREPLKKTAGNNWVHIRCALWMPEVRFSNAAAFEQAEGIPLIPASRFASMCTICSQRHRGACVECAVCSVSFHVGCAARAGHRLSFFVQPVKTGRRDGLSGVITLGCEEDGNIETGSVTALVICRSHDLTNTKFSLLHESHEQVRADNAEPGFNALQLYARTYKQADLALTGTTRKAILLDASRRAFGLADPAAVSTGDGSSYPPSKPEPSYRCAICSSDTSFVWFPVPDNAMADVVVSGTAMLCGRCNRNRHRESKDSANGAGAAGHSPPNHIDTPTSRESLVSALTAAAEAGRLANRLGLHVRARATSPSPSASIPPSLVSTLLPTAIPNPLTPSMPISHPGPVPNLTPMNGSPSPSVGVRPGPPHPHQLPHPLPPTYLSGWAHRPPLASNAAPVYIPPPPPPAGKRDWPMRSTNGSVPPPPNTQGNLGLVSTRGNPSSQDVDRDSRDFDRGDRDLGQMYGPVSRGSPPGETSSVPHHQPSHTHAHPHSFPHSHGSGAVPQVSSSSPLSSNGNQSHRTNHLPSSNPFTPYPQQSNHSIHPSGGSGNGGQGNNDNNGPANRGVRGNSPHTSSVHPLHGHILSPPRGVVSSSRTGIPVSSPPRAFLMPGSNQGGIHMSSAPHPHAHQQSRPHPAHSHSLTHGPILQPMSSVPGGVIPPPSSGSSIQSSNAPVPTQQSLLPSLTSHSHAHSSVTPVGGPGPMSRFLMDDPSSHSSYQPSSQSSQLPGQSSGRPESLSNPVASSSTSIVTLNPSRPEAKGASANASLKNLLS